MAMKTGTRIAGLIRLVRNAVIGVLAIGATGAIGVLALPATAEAGQNGPKQARHVAEKLDRIAYDVNQVPGIRGPRRQGAEIDRLQSRLYRLDRVSDRQRSRLARRNEVTIERLQHRLRRMERRVDAQIASRGGNRAQGRDWRRDGTRDGRRVIEWGYREPTVVRSGNAWRY